MTPVTFQRLFRDAGPDREHPATPGALGAVLAAMAVAADGDLNPFRVKVRFDDGSAVTVSPKGWGRM